MCDNCTYFMSIPGQYTRVGRHVSAAKSMSVGLFCIITEFYNLNGIYVIFVRYSYYDDGL